MKNFTQLLLLLSFTGSLFAIDGPEIYQKMKDREKGNTSHTIMKMTLIESSGDTKDRIIETWTMKYDTEKNLSQSVMEFKSPASVKGTRFLQIQREGRDDDQWIYLPALGRVRRIASSEGNSSFMGSDFTYDDMQIENDDSNSKHVLLREEKVGDYECYVLESSSAAEDASYSKLISWITKDHFIPVKVEFYNKKLGKLEKIMTIEGKIEQINGIYTVMTTRMKNIEDDHQTVLEIMRNKNGIPYIEFNKKVNPARFTQHYLQTGK